MATLAAPFDALTLGTHTLQISLLGWHDAGSCSVTENSAFAFAAHGTYSALGQSGTFDLRLVLTDRDPNATSGACQITNAGETLSGTYARTDADTITFDADERHVVASRAAAGGVDLTVSGYPKVRVVT